MCVCVLLRSRSLIAVHSYTRTQLRALLWVHRFQFILSFSRCCYCCLCFFFFFVNNNENTLKHARTQARHTQQESAHTHTHTFITQRACTRVLWHFASVFVNVWVRVRVYGCLLFIIFVVVVDGCCCCWREKENLKGKKHSHCAQTLWPHYVSNCSKFENYRKCNWIFVIKTTTLLAMFRSRSLCFSLTHTHAWITPQSTKFSHFFTRARERATLKRPRCSESFSRLDGPTTMWLQHHADENTRENTN